MSIPKMTVDNLRALSQFRYKGLGDCRSSSTSWRYRIYNNAYHEC